MQDFSFLPNPTHENHLHSPGCLRSCIVCPGHSILRKLKPSRLPYEPPPLLCEGVKLDFWNVFSGNKSRGWCLPGRKPYPRVKSRALWVWISIVCVPDTFRFPVTLAPQLCKRNLAGDHTWPSCFLVQTSRVSIAVLHSLEKCLQLHLGNQLCSPKHIPKMVKPCTPRVNISHANVRKHEWGFLSLIILPLPGLWEL